MRPTGSATWVALLHRYRRHRARPFWGYKVFVPDARRALSHAHLRAMRMQARSAAKRLDEAIRLLTRDRAFPTTPHELR